MIVLDLGSGHIRAGFAGEDSPKEIFKPLIAKQKISENDVEYFYGSEAEKYRDELSLSCPIERGFVNNWDEMNDLLENMFSYMLKSDPSESDIILVEKSIHTVPNRKNIIRNLFEKFNANRISILDSTLLSLIAYGNFTGTVVDIGEGSTKVKSFNDLEAIQSSEIFYPFGGMDLTNYLSRNLFGHDCSTVSERELVKAIKEKYCYVAVDYAKELSNNDGSESNLRYKMPDGSSIDIGRNAFRCPEILFDPMMAGSEISGIHKIIFESINNSPQDLRKSLSSNIYLSGGTTNCQNFQERLTKELQYILPSGVKIRSSSSNERENSSWLGASIVSTMESPDKKWISRQDYDEQGESVIEGKF